MVFEKVVVIDARGHLLGRLASVVAKELLLGCVRYCITPSAAHVESERIMHTGCVDRRIPPSIVCRQHVVVVRTEELNISGSRESRRCHQSLPSVQQTALHWRRLHTSANSAVYVRVFGSSYAAPWRAVTDCYLVVCVSGLIQ